jgi:2-aminomuconate deaminase
MKPLGNYPALRRAGPVLHVSGMSARLAEGGCAGVQRDAQGRPLAYDVAEQTRVVIRKIAAALATEGAGLGDCVSLSCYLLDMQDFAAFNQAYGEFFSEAGGPARTTVAVHQLPHPEMRVEITATAYQARAAAEPSA